MARKNSTRDNWQKHYQKFNASSLTQREYCIQNDLGYWTFNKWKRRFDKEITSTSLQQLPVKYAPTKSERLEIIFHKNLRISIPEDFSETTLIRVISILDKEL